MSEFLQLHLLTSYAPSNLNRDDLGRPKTAMFGGTQRLRVSSQSLKRAWRTSEVFSGALAGHVGTRTKSIGEYVRNALVERKMSPEKAEHWGRSVVEAFSGGAKVAKVEKAKATPKKGTKPTKVAASEDETATTPAPAGLKNDQLIHLSAAEFNLVNQLIEKVAREGEVSPEQVSQLLTNGRGSVDVALFGRMLAEAPEHNVNAAAQVAHALSVHRVTVEDDYFTAVDDLNSKEQTGAAHIGTNEFAAAVFYQYVCVNRTLLLESLDGTEALVSKALRALTEACATVSPSGKQATFGSPSRASYLLAERGSQQPRSLSVAFLKDVQGRQGDYVEDAIARLGDTRAKMDQIYGRCWGEEASFSVPQGQGTLTAVLDFVGRGK